MRSVWAVLLAACCCIANNGCLARQVARDGIGLRQALEEMYTDQVMDNLIRVVEHRPFVQLAYSGLSVQDFDKAGGNANGGEVDFPHSSVFDASKAGILKFTRTAGVMGKYPVGLTGERDRTMTFKADPVTDQNYIYVAYLNFARNPALFMVGCQKPPGPVHICRRCGDKWYWVPAEAGPEFLQLVLTTSLLPPHAAPTVYWDTTITGFAARLDANGAGLPNRWVVSLGKDVPNDEGYLAVTPQGGRKVWLPVERVDMLPFTADKKGGGPNPGGPGAPTKILYTQFGPKTLAIDQLPGLSGAATQFYARNIPNLGFRQPADAQNVQDTLDSIRMLLSKSTVVNP